MRGPQTWEEARRVVLEIEQREATHKATANSILNTDGGSTADSKPLAKMKEELKKAKDEAKRAKAEVAAAKAKPSSTFVGTTVLALRGIVVLGLTTRSSESEF